MNKIEFIDLVDIDASNNIRRASPAISNSGVDLLKECVVKGLGNSMVGWSKFVSMLANDNHMLSLARSLAITGQIHPITVVKAGKKYRCISGQRRYVGMVAVDCLRNILRYGETEEIAAAKKVFAPRSEAEPEINYDALQKQTRDTQIQANIRAEMTEEAIETLAFNANEEVLPMTDIDWANWISKKREEINSKTGKPYTWEQLANIAHKSVSWLTLRQNLLCLPAEWKNKLDSKEINITKAAAYADEIADAGQAEQAKPAPISDPEAKAEPIAEDDSEGVIVTPTKPKKRKLTPEEMPERPDGGRIEWSDDEEDEEEIDDEDSTGEDGGVAPTSEEVVPVRDWTEGKRKKRSSKKPKMLSYEEVINLLRALDKTDVHGIDLLSKVLQMPYEDAEVLAGTSAEAAE